MSGSLEKIIEGDLGEIPRQLAELRERRLRAESLQGESRDVELAMIGVRFSELRETARVMGEVLDDMPSDGASIRSDFRIDCRILN